MSEIVLDEKAALARAIPREAMVACKLAFIDCKLPGSDQKENYSIIGPGVTQSDGQVVNLSEPHGFSVGAAAMPGGVTNNLHLHFSAEVFIIYSGRWKFRWGAGECAGEIEAGPGDVLSMPTWIFRGFSNMGSDSGWLFTALGGDDTGGIIWHPDILDAAASHGLFLGHDNTLLEGEPGRPPSAALIRPLTQEEMTALPCYTAEAMAQRLLSAQARAWSRGGWLGNAAGADCELAPVIGYGLSEQRGVQAPILNPHGFSLDWLRLGVHCSTQRFLLKEKQVLIVIEGAAEVVLNDPGRQVRVPLQAQAVYSVPAGVWREVRQVGNEPAVIAVICAGDHRKRVIWPKEVLGSAAASDIALDPDGYIASRHLLPATALGVGEVSV